MRNLLASFLFLVLALATAVPPRLHADFAAAPMAAGGNAHHVTDEAHPCQDHDGAGQAGGHKSHPAGNSACLLACMVLPVFEQPRPEPVSFPGVKLAIPLMADAQGCRALPPERPPREVG